MKVRILILSTILVTFLAGFVCFKPSGFFSAQSRMKWFLLTEAEPVFTHAGPFLSVIFFDKDNGIAVSPITIDKTDDGGTNWTAVKNWDENNRGFSSIISANGLLWIVGSEKNKPLILTTKTHGYKWEDWQKINLSGKSTTELQSKFSVFYDMCFDPSGNAWAVGDGGVAQLIRGDREWQVSNIADSKDTLYSVSCNSAGQVWAVGENGAVFHFQDSWAKRKIDENSVFTRVVSFGKEIWILGGKSSSADQDKRKGVLLRSKDGGQTWENKTPESASVLNDIYINGVNGWLVGNDGSLYSTRNGGNSWSKENSPTKNNLTKLFPLDSQNIWAVGERVSVLKYQDSSLPLPERKKNW